MKEMLSLLLNLTLSTNVFILAILVIRFLFKNSSKNSRLLLWVLVGVKLILPFNLESRFSLVPRSITDTTSDIGNIATEVVLPQAEAVKNTVSLELIFSVLWVVGASIILIYGAVSFWRLHKNISDAIKKEENIFQSEKIVSPFVLGVLRPKIYTPFNLDDETYSHIVSHEKSHIKNLDHVIKLVSFALVAVHWFNPFVWVCFKLITKDIELACDERVVKNYSLEKRKSYATALLNCAVNDRKGLIYPVAFGEVSVKDRIKSVVAYKKTLKAVLFLFLGVAVASFVFFGTVPETSMKPLEEAEVTEEQIEEPTTEVYVEESTTEPATEAVTEVVTEEQNEVYVAYQEEQPEINLEDFDPEYREIFSIAQEEGEHVGEVMPANPVERPTKETTTEARELWEITFPDISFNRPSQPYAVVTTRSYGPNFPTMPVISWDPMYP